MVDLYGPPTLCFNATVSEESSLGASRWDRRDVIGILREFISGELRIAENIDEPIPVVVRDRTTSSSVTNFGLGRVIDIAASVANTPSRSDELNNQHSLRLVR